jgi:N-acetylmuramic acid 6-phosphate etherase
LSTWTLALEGGATHTHAALYTPEGTLHATADAGPCNPVAYGMPRALQAATDALRPLLAHTDTPLTLTAGIAGAFDPPLRRELAQALAALPGIARAIVATDVHPILLANANGDPAILVVAGTGSNVIAVQDRHWIQVGGRGALLGDDGSAYAIATEALRMAAAFTDGLAPATRLAETLPAALGLKHFEETVRWSMRATKADIAALAATVLHDADTGDGMARRIVQEQAQRLVRHIAIAHRRIGQPAGCAIFTIGGLLEHHSLFAETFHDDLQRTLGITARIPHLRGHAAIRKLALCDTLPPWAECHHAENTPRLAPTEQPPTGRTLDQMTPREIVETMCAADRALPDAVARQSETIAHAIEDAARAIANGGRLIYLGAGTSGRLGVLDASECPPTFGIPADRVIGIMAGGDHALRYSVEGAEDDQAQARRDLDALQLTSDDFVLGIAASGTTPYVLAGLDHAQKHNATTALLCCNPDAQAPVDHLIRIDSGPEVLAGSTRLKAGTATKLVLNILSTGAMARAGYILDGLMIVMIPGNAKLRARAARIVAQIARVSENSARESLNCCAFNIAQAILHARDGLTPTQAEERIRAARGNLRKALRGENP